MAIHSRLAVVVEPWKTAAGQGEIAEFRRWVQQFNRLFAHRSGNSSSGAGLQVILVSPLLRIKRFGVRCKTQDLQAS